MFIQLPLHSGDAAPVDIVPRKPDSIDWLRWRASAGCVYFLMLWRCVDGISPVGTLDQSCAASPTSKIGHQGGSGLRTRIALAMKVK
ncbi:hypothetical protein ANACOL_00322 [Anaerotruncus colihominis DSM 17241]|uniref:Uncharacterized protein n=1 Tax=Anaerotruncus colihominis DSM 17241 TaxID=445972 RepID=B0P6E7_9FIRM|nr:hypothetical protein ANACOL_00322 [Anaerotruncus colihominis DSM 17241]